MIGAYTQAVMADNGGKTTSKARGKRESVLGSLPATRTERFGRPRREVAVATVQPRGARPAKPKPPRATAPAPKKPAAVATPAPRKTTAVAKPSGKPTAVTAGCPPLERPKTSATPPPRPIGRPTGTQLVTTAIQATGELARIGVTVGGQVLKRAVDRLPRP
jgi:pyruvate/2-oxoglutarate dehydrogenase complex dihydrolipoamide acyltransferase (E2) component